MMICRPQAWVLGCALLALAACSDEPAGTASGTPAPPPAQPAAIAPVPPVVQSGPGVASGRWTVVSVVDAGRGGGMSPAERQALIGRGIAVEPALVERADGRRCAAPSFVQAQVEAARVFAARAPLPGLDGPLTVVEARCAGAPFLRLAVTRPGAVLAEHGAAWVLLSPAAAAPAQVAGLAEGGPQPAMVKPRGSTVWISTQAARKDDKPAAGQKAAGALHLESYRSDKGARQAWAELHGKYPALNGLEPQFQPIALPGKGNFVRVLAVGTDRDDLSRRCVDLVKAGHYCRVVEQVAMGKP